MNCSVESVVLNKGNTVEIIRTIMCWIVSVNNHPYIASCVVILVGIIFVFLRRKDIKAETPIQTPSKEGLLEIKKLTNKTISASFFLGVVFSILPTLIKNSIGDDDETTALSLYALVGVCFLITALFMILRQKINEKLRSR